jgi:hypothetical protein
MTHNALVGYRRLEGAAAAAVLARLYTASRLFVNFFQPSFKLKEKLRVGGRTVKRYDPPQTPCARRPDRRDIADPFDHPTTLRSPRPSPVTSPSRLETILGGTEVEGTHSIASPEASYAVEMPRGARIRRTSAAAGGRLHFGFA